jgi:hypothetical protein
MAQGLLAKPGEGRRRQNSPTYVLRCGMITDSAAKSHLHWSVRMSRLAYSIAVVLSFTVLTTFLVWSLRYYEQVLVDQGLAGAPRTEWGFIPLLLVAFAIAIGIAVAARAQGLKWRKAFLSGAYIAIVFCSAFGAAVALRQTTDDLWAAYAAIVGAAIGILSAGLDAWVKAKAGGWR